MTYRGWLDESKDSERRDYIIEKIKQAKASRDLGDEKIDSLLYWARKLAKIDTVTTYTEEKKTRTAEELEGICYDENIEDI